VDAADEGGAMSDRARVLMASLALLLASTTSAVADWSLDDNVLAYRLYAEGRYEDAAEVFTDPAWKGIALYRSSQWWRAAEAFVRSDDPLSAYNLGNCYVQLGYHALALDAYLRALAGDPTLEDARHNADLMRQVLAAEDEGRERSGRRDAEEEIDRLDTESEEEPPGRGGGGDRDSEAGTGDERERGARAAPSSPGDAPMDETGVERDGTPPGDEDQDGAGGAVRGASAEPDDAGRASGTSESDTIGEHSDAAGSRAALESAQATEQWLNRIRHDPARFLDKRIRLEMARRRAAGQAAPAGGSGW